MYYQLRQTPVIEGLYMTYEPNLGVRVRWRSGHRLPVSVPIPVEVELDDQYGTGLPDLFDDNILLMTSGMVEALRHAGVDNFDSYDAILVDRKRKKNFDDFKAIQIIGRIAAADLGASDIFDPMNVGHTMVQFRRLALDEMKIAKALMFRLHENTSTILIQEKVKDSLQRLALKHVSIVPAGQQVLPDLEVENEE